MENSNKPIYPIQDGGYPSNESVIEQNSLIGLTKREYFAGIAMNGILSKYTLSTPEDQFLIAKLSVELADEILEHLNPTPKK